jgi:precorrin-2/cobalt-factor-2 C20-methyltransferase
MSDEANATGMGRLIGLSLGPGDPGLITRAAWDQLQRRDALWTYPTRSTKTPSYAFDIVQRAGLQPPDGHLALLFPMTHDEEKLVRSWQRAADAVLPALRAGQDVLFLVEGDASTYATFGHLARTLRTLEPGVEVETIAGVNAFAASAATLGRPLAEQDDTIAVVPAAYGVAAVDRLLADFDTLVLMKVKPLLDELLDWLQRRELLAGGAFIERCGAPDERVLRGNELLTLRGQKVSYLSLMLVHNPHRVRGERVRGCLKKNSPALETQPAENTEA